VPIAASDPVTYTVTAVLMTYRTKIPYLPEVYADSAYANKKNDEKLGKQNNKVLHRAYRNTPLTDRQNNPLDFRICLKIFIPVLRL
jgi:hypothetical protein